MDNPGVKLPPPLAYVAFFGLGLLLQAAIPLPSPPTGASRVVGWALAVAALVVAALSFNAFRAARTTIRPDRGAASLITTGVFRFTRNPLYLSLLLLYCGLAALVGESWPLALAPLLVVTLERHVIAREERHLAERFGGAYDDYRKRVRRWI